MTCLGDDTLLDLAEGRRSIDPSVEAHLAECDDCRVVLAIAVRGADTLVDARGNTTTPSEDREPSWDELGPGVVIAGRYELERFLGAGAMGVVYSAKVQNAHWLELPDHVALKISRSFDPELRRRFRREANITLNFLHPNAVRTFDVVAETVDRGPCLVQELLVGETLHARLSRGPLPLREAARVIVPVAHALLAAHARGIVHRDVKPQNVFLTSDRVVVLDFGIAKLLPTWGAHTSQRSTSR